MNRGVPLQRRTPLTSSASLARSPLGRATSPVEARTQRPPSPRKPPRSTGPQGGVQDAVRERDKGVCVTCGGAGTAWDALVIHHRTGRGMGGSRAGWVNRPANLLLVHESENLAFEADPDLMARAYTSGWKVRRPTDPATVPVRYWDGLWLLDNNGNRRKVDRP